MDFIFDGTNICIDKSPTKEASLLPLFQVMYPLLMDSYKCKCFFDEGTYFGSDLDEAIFNWISTIPNRKMPLVAPRFFEVVPSKDRKNKPQVADDQILALANRTDAYIISFDNYKDEEFQKKYNWSLKKTGERVLKIFPHQDRIQLMRQENGDDESEPIEVLNLEKPEGNLEELATKVLNLIEGRYGRLVGKVKDLNVSRNLGIGKIIRRYDAYNLGLLAFLKEGHHPDFNFAHSKGMEVRFRLCINKGKMRNGQMEYHLNAHDLTPLGTIEEENEALWEENTWLKHRVEELEEQLSRLNTSHSIIVGKLHEEETENNNLFLQISSLENEIMVLRNQLQSRVPGEELDEEQAFVSDFQDLQRDYDELLKDYKSQRGLLQLLRKSGGGGDSQSNLDALIGEVEKLKEENRLIREQLENSASVRVVQNAVEVPQNIDPKPLLKWWNTLSDDWRAAFAHRFNMAPNNPNLVVLERIQTTQSLELRGRHSMIPLTLPFKLKDIHGIKGLKELQILNLSYNSIPDFRDIEELENLHELILVGNKPIHSLKGIEKLRHLSLLNIEAAGVSEEEINWLRANTLSMNLEIRF